MINETRYKIIFLSIMFKLKWDDIIVKSKKYPLSFEEFRRKLFNCCWVNITMVPGGEVVGFGW